LRGVSKDGPRALVADPSRRGQEAAPQDEGSVGLVKTAGRCVHALARRRGPIRRVVSIQGKPLQRLRAITKGTGYGSPPEPVIGPAIAGPVGGDDEGSFRAPGTRPLLPAVAAGDRAVADRLALFIQGQERRSADAVPQRGAAEEQAPDLSSISPDHFIPHRPFRHRNGLRTMSGKLCPIAWSRKNRIRAQVSRLTEFAFHRIVGKRLTYRNPN
jgi:hypothetical protein